MRPLQTTIGAFGFASLRVSGKTTTIIAPFGKALIGVKSTLYALSPPSVAFVATTSALRIDEATEF